MHNVHESSEGTKNDNDVKLKEFRRRLRRCRRNCPAQISEIVRLSDNPEMYQKEVLRVNQAKLGKVMNYTTTRRLEQGQVSYKDDYREKTKGSIRVEKGNSEIAKLIDVALRYSVKEQEIKSDSGTLEAHVDGFQYTTSSPIFQTEFSYNIIKHVFFQSEDDKMLPLLHFHLYEPINLNGTEVKDIQFQLVKTLAGSADDTFKTEKEKDYNEDFEKFVKNVKAKWNPWNLTFELPMKKYEFHGSSVFALTTFCLAAIVKAPFFVVTLSEIEFVNLAHLRDSEIDMTIVLKDFTQDVFEINSVPSTSAAAIKYWLDLFDVKYYENGEKLEWNQILEGIRLKPQDFASGGCWQSLNLESSAAAALSSDSSSCTSEEYEFNSEEGSPRNELLFK